MSYHINPSTGKPGLCVANPNNPRSLGCKYARNGETIPHYDSIREAMLAYEQSNEDNLLPEKKNSLAKYRKMFSSEITSSGEFKYTNSKDIVESYYESEEQLSEVNLTPDERKALNYYSSSNFRWVNGRLFGDTVEESREHLSDEEFEKIVGTLDNVLERGEDKKQVIFRGISTSAMRKYTNSGKEVSNSQVVSDYIEKFYRVGEVTKIDGYVSCTSSADYAYSIGRGGGLAFEIIAKSGVNISSLSDYPEEQELLMKRGSEFMVVDIIENTRLRDYRATLIRMVEL